MKKNGAASSGYRANGAGPGGGAPIPRQSSQNRKEQELNKLIGKKSNDQNAIKLYNKVMGSPEVLEKELALA